MDDAPDDDPRLDSALELAFGAPAVASVPPSGGATLGRFEPTGEIGRGGLGIVYAAFDPILGREVAIKVLRPDRAGDPVEAARLVEEARVAARLEHPGVIPVHEIGIGSDGRPFLAMQRMRGRTFSEILAARASPLDGQHAHLSTLLAVAQAVAYAHSRSVVHRDLKPANVILGEFGEVRVVDWGLAKTSPGTVPPDRSTDVPAGSPPTETHSAHGTPRYMPPEQALGRAQDIDARSDVFALGGMLTEILTGHPPYDGDTPLADAAGARLDGARARLGGAPCDAALRGLALDALEPERSRRPANGRAFAERLERHFASSAERARRAEIAEAEERVRAQAERRRRRLVRAVATGAAIVALAAGGLWWARRDESAARARRADERVAAGLSAAGEARGRAIESDDVARWETAVELARAGRRLSEDADATSDARRRADDVVALAVRGARDAATLDARRRADRELLDGLSDLDLGLGDGEDRSLDAIVSDRRLTESFRRAGLEREGAPELGGLAARAKTGPRLARAFAVWARYRKAAGGDPEPMLLEADAADPDPLRIRLRRGAPTEEFVRELEALDRVTLSPETLVSVAVFLHDVAHDPRRALAFADAAVSQGPGDFAAQSVAFAARLDGDDLDGAFAAATALTALRPGSALGWTHLAAVQFRRGRPADALAAADRAYTLRPTSLRTRMNFAAYAAAAGDGWRGALIALPAHDERVAEVPKSAHAHLQRGKCLGSLARPELARADFEEALRLRPDYAAVYGRLSRALLLLRDVEGAVRWATATRDALVSDPSSHAWLGEVLLEAGRYEDANAAFEAAAAHNDRSVPDFNARLEEMTAEAKRRRDLEARLDEAFRAAPTERVAALSLAAVLLARGRASDAVTVHRGVLERIEAGGDPVASASLRTRAAIAAAVDAASGSRSAAESRSFALDCLRRGLDALGPTSPARRPGSHFELLGSWRAEPRLAPIRDAGALAPLPADERARCDTLWHDVDAILAEAERTPPAPGLDPH